MKNLIEKVDEVLEWGGMKKRIIFLAVSAISLLLSIFDAPMPFDTAWLAIILCGLPILLEAMIGLVTEFDIKADVLVSLALVAAVCIGENFAAGEVAFIMQLGELLEDLTVSKARAGIEKLVHLTPQTARITEDGKERIIAAEKVKINDILRVLPGESVPVDGVIISGDTSINQAVMTGEPLPVDKTVGDKVMSGTINQFGAFEMKAERTGENSSIQRMIKLVKSADADKAKIVSLADRWATWIVVAALTAALVTFLVTGEAIRFVTVLVVFCPCALVLATPTAIMAAIGNAAKHGFLARQGDALERLARVDRIAFDKTGTITCGMPKVVKTISLADEYTEDDILSLAASAEMYSEHPLGNAVVKEYEKVNPKSDLKADNFKMLPGMGVSANVEGMSVLAGNKKLMSENEIELPSTVTADLSSELNKGAAIIYIAADRRFIGCIVLSDTIRSESKAMISELKQCGVNSVLVTGDNENTANAIAAEIGIDTVYADCLPEDKLGHMEKLKNGGGVCMIGDGINDAPALKKADVGIAMGGIGSDIAVDAADIVLVEDDIKELPHLIRLSRRMMRTIKCNIIFSMSLNFLAIALAVTGLLNPVIGALVHNSGSVLVIINSALLLKWRKK